MSTPGPRPLVPNTTTDHSPRRPSVGATKPQHVPPSRADIDKAVEAEIQNLAVLASADQKRLIASKVESSILHDHVNGFDSQQATRNVETVHWPTSKAGVVGHASATVTVPLWGSIVIEAVFLVLGLLGVKLPASTKAYEKAFEPIAKSESKFSGLLKELSTAKTHQQQAITIFKIASGVGLGNIKDMVKGVLKGMQWWEWVELSVKVTAQLAAFFATDGAAVAAEIVLVLPQAVNFVQKIAHFAAGQH